MQEKIQKVFDQVIVLDCRSRLMLNIPIDFPRLPNKTPSYRHEILEIRSSLIQELQQQNQDLTLLFLATWFCLIYRYTQQEEIIIAVSISDLTPLATTNKSLALFQVEFTNHLTFRQLLLSLTEIKARDFTINPSLCQVGFGDFDLLKVSTSSSGFDLILSLDFAQFNDLKKEGYQGQLIYNSHLFEAETIQRLINHFQTILTGIIHQPQQLINHLPLLTESEKHQLLKEWTNTKTDYPQESTIHQLFQLQAHTTPNKIAIAYKNQELTYEQLAQKSNQLAHYLQQMGVTTETLVGLYLEPSPNLIIGILGILKAGGAYLPLDTSAPKARLKTILEDAQPPVLITEKSALKYLAQMLKTTHLLDIDNYPDLTNYPHHIAPSNAVNIDNLAYVMFTSGSTGKPKGVCVLHRGVIRLVKNTNYAHFGADEVVLQLASIAFDAATFEIWSPLLNGGKLVLMPEKMPSLPAIGAVIKQYNITTLWLTAGLFHLIVEERLEYLLPLRQLLAGGDVLSLPHVKKVLANLPNCQLINGYGPTENTTFTCCYKITADDTTKESIPIGYPIANTQVYILDNYLQLVPIGIPGELYIGGDGLARGYLNRFDLTTERFIPNPFSEDSNARLYKTGDRVRWRKDGNIEFLGRVDFQIKIRGYRVELGEIEATLLQHPQVRSTVVLAREDSSKNKQLIAYIVPKEDINSKELRHFLADRLPPYMMPSELIFLKEFPLNANGKVDRKKLTLLTSNSQPIKRNIIPPQTQLETKLVEIWTEILGKPVSIDDQFLELGGNSLQAIQIISRIRNICHIDLPIQAILQDSTIAKLARVIQGSKPQKNPLNWSTLILKPVANKGDFPLSLYQERMWLMTQLAESNPVYNLPMVFRLQGLLNIPILEESINLIIQRHESLRTFFPLVEKFPVQRILPTFSISITIESLLTPSKTEQETQLQQRLKKEISHPFNLSQTPPIRCLLIKLDTDDVVFVMVIHHLIGDGWSLSIILEELSTYYNSLSTNSPWDLTPIPLQYKDFSTPHRQWLEQPQIYHPLVDYWSQQLENAPTLMKFPTDYSRPSRHTFNGSIQPFYLETELIQKLQNLSQQTQSTLYMILLATFFILVHLYSGEEDIIITVPVANRNLPELESTVGCFSSIIPLRLLLSENLDFLQVLEKVKQVSLSAYNYQEFSLEQMLRKIKKRDFRHIPWFQLVFNFLNVPITDLEFSGVTSRKLMIEKPSALFDLMVLFSATSTGLEGIIEYNINLFKPSTIHQLIGHFQTLLQEIASTPQQKIEQLAVLINGIAPSEIQEHFLPSNDPILTQKSPVFVPVRDDWEMVMTQLWQNLLNVSFIGLQDSFFDLGGHSLLAMKLLAKIEEDFKVNISLAAFLKNPTIEALIKLIKTGDEDFLESSIFPINTQGNNPPLFFINSFSQAQILGTYLDKNQPFYILNIFGITEFLKSQIDSLKLENIATKFIEDMQKVQPQGPYFLITFCADSFLTFEIAQQLKAQGQKIALLLFIDAFWQPEDLVSNLYWSNFRQFGLNYLIEKFNNRFNLSIERLIIHLQKLQSQLYFYQDQSLPRHLEDVKLLKAFEIARNQYSPQPYQGKLLLFLSQEYGLFSSSQLGNFFTEGVEIQEIPGYHSTLFKAPYISILVQKLQAQLKAI